jgi:multidrug efflux pump subunit AcrB
MHEVAGPVVSLALILSAVFIPTIFIAGITGKLYQQFALTIVISVILSAFNALSLSPALAAMLLKPKDKNHSRGPLGKFYSGFNRLFDQARNGYMKVAGTHPDWHGCPFARRAAADLIFAGRRPGLPLHQRATALCLVAGTHRCRL